MNKAYVALGTNIEPREDYLKRAIQFIQDEAALSIRSQSSIYETKPVGYTKQHDFLNMVIEIHTTLSPEQLLSTCQLIENQLGRKREIRFGPRTIDLDILLYNQEHIHTEQLIVPHPRMNERAFVLIPLQEIAPTMTIPYWNESIEVLLEKLHDNDKKDVMKWTKSV